MKGVTIQKFQELQQVLLESSQNFATLKKINTNQRATIKRYRQLMNETLKKDKSEQKENALIE